MLKNIVSKTKQRISLINCEFVICVVFIDLLPSMIHTVSEIILMYCLFYF